MTRPRKALISLADTPYYHITSRCVRIPVQACHRFRSKPATHSIRKLPPIPVKPATLKRVRK